jgi:hypothetical protein
LRAGLAASSWFFAKYRITTLPPVRAGHGTTVTTFGGKAAASRPHDCIAGREALCRSKAAWAAGTANKPKQSIDVNSPLIRQF